jgi:hypothetical protein
MAAVRATPTLVGQTTNGDEQMTTLDKRYDVVREGQRGLDALISEAGVR